MRGVTDRQRELLDEWLPGARPVRDHAWGLLEGAVLELVTADGMRVVAKTGGPANGHIGREITAHESGATARLADLVRTSRLVGADRAANLLVLEWLEGDLVLGSAAEDDPGVHRDAGRLLRSLHDQGRRDDPDYEEHQHARSLESLDRPHRIPPDRAAVARRILETAPRAGAVLVPTHGDWQPRNWLLHGGELRVIDWGRFDWRPASSDLGFLDGRAWIDRPDLEAAFLDGYGDDPRDAEAWRVSRLRQAVGTAVWAHQVGDAAFEAEGLELLDRALAGF